MQKHFWDDVCVGTIRSSKYLTLMNLMHARRQIFRNISHPIENSHLNTCPLQVQAKSDHYHVYFPRSQVYHAVSISTYYVQNM
jgi:hypothetical protein